ncbi:MAG: heterodisulfide reductase-related iron-sulfur binding cluster [Candidatus Glassbacteria bacterium]
MRYGYYTGCSITATEKELDFSLRGIFDTLSINFEVLETPGCCGSLFEGGGDLAPVREMLVSKLLDTCGEIKDLIVPCPNCYRIIRSATGEAAEGLPRVVHPLEFLARDISRDTLKSKRIRQIKGLKISPFYGCVFKPLSEGKEGSENPRYMEEMFDALGIETVWFPDNNECCGGQRHMDSLDAWGAVSKRIVDSASSWGVDIIAVACSQCHTLLEGSIQSDKIIGQDKVVIMYYSQIAGYIMGLDKRSLFPAGESSPLS